MTPNNKLRVQEHMSLPEGWETLLSDDRSSTIAYFIGGWKNSDGDEILIWRGSEHNGEVQLTSHLGNEIPDWATCIVEIHKDGELDVEAFAQDRDEAWKRARQYLIMFEEQYM